MMQKKGGRLVRLADLRPQAWKNGGGVTYEIACEPPRAEADAVSADFRWRVSRAVIERDGPFSVFPGMARWIVLQEGNGFTLSFPDRAKLVVTQRFEVETLPGGNLAHCTLQAGPVSVLNVIALEDLPLRVNVARTRAPLPSLGHAMVTPGGVSLRLDESRVLQVAVAV